MDLKAKSKFRFKRRNHVENSLNYPRTYKGGVYATLSPHKVFQSFFLEDKTSAPDVLSSC